MKIAVTIIIIVILVFLGFLLLKTETSIDQPNDQKELDKAPSFSLKDINGNAVNLEDFAGKTLVINSWASWCFFCIDELPDFLSLQEEFGDKITVIAINRQESLEKSKSFTDQLGVTEGMVYLLDPTDSFYKSIGGLGMPETIFVNDKGEIVIHKRGPMALEEMISKVNSVLGQN